MSELKNFPFKNQLNSPTFDGLLDENAHMNCVPTSIAAGLQYFTGKEYEPDEIKDAVYGQSYTGGTAAVDYVEYCAHQGVRLYSESGSPGYLVGRAHYQLSRGAAVLGTIPSCYCPPAARLNPGLSHCIAFYKDSSGVLIAMNPWQAISQGNTDQWWIDRLCFDQIWIMEKGSMSVPQGWKDDGTTLVAPNGKKVVKGFRSWVLAHNWHPENLPLEEEHGDGNGTGQLFVSTELEWEAARGVYEVPLGAAYKQMSDNYSTVHIQLVQAQDQVKALQAENAALKAAPAPKAPPSNLVHDLTALADQVQNIIDAL